ncbi:uncharacterized protein LOC120282756 [Dioscorea cayenensis subsp. rotundata]|uniref:Uncharacterized protein LOC120282756 n=1 Tax=Dioscorea cayennensis subsp. rotundata TaxID=55577 RepID=A0AB40D2C6_DIOCR|nr:uncharacterized protein LOC120282756 [Dioscorea cayenensis subsp. rotundata]
MATSAFKSTTKRSSNGGAVDHRRSRSLSRGPDRFPPASRAVDSAELLTPRGRFVNTLRGSGFPEISLDDLTDEFFKAGRDSGGDRRGSDVSPGRRGRSASRQSGVSVGDRLRRQRSASVARHRDSESNPISNGNLQHHKLASSNVLKRSMSHKDLFRSHDSSSSHSSTLTDDEAQSAPSNRSGPENTIQAVYAIKKSEHPAVDGDESGLYDVMRKEVRHAVEEIKQELEKVMVKTEPEAIVNHDLNGSNVIQAISEIRRAYTSKLEESEKRRLDLLAELAVEEQRGQELSNIVRELLPAPKENAAPERPLFTRRRTNDRTRISKRLTEEAEKYFEDFLSNVDDTDLSFDGDRSDASSTIRGCTNLRDPRVYNIMDEGHCKMAKATSVPPETDGVVLPWLQWETSNDCSPSPCKTNGTTGLVIDSTKIKDPMDTHNNISWESENYASYATVTKKSSAHVSISAVVGGPKQSSFDIDEYMQLQHDQDLLFETVRQHQRIFSGSLLLCRRNWI